jgi:hypothetical protein
MAVVTLAAMSQQVRAATITTSVGSDYEWPTYCGVGQTRNIVVQMTPPPPAGWFYQNCTLTITKPDGINTTITAISDFLGHVHYSYTPSVLGTFQLSFRFPGQGILSDFYTAVSSTVHDWDVYYDPDTTPPT